MRLGSLLCHLRATVLIMLLSLGATAQHPFSFAKLKKRNVSDTLQVEAGKLVIFPDTLFIPAHDTVVIAPPGVRVKIRENPYAQSERFYDSLEHKSYRNNLTRKLYQLVIRRGRTELSDSVSLLKAETPFEPYQGREISKIFIRSVEFLSGNITDTAEVTRTRASNVLDALHKDTHSGIIRRSLLFGIGDSVSPYQLADNERLLRQLPFIRDARIVVLPDLDDAQKVDIYVVTQDRFSLFIDGDFSGFDDFKFEVGSRNIFGTGNKFSVTYQYFDLGNPRSGYELKFKDFNIRSTWMSGELIYSDLWDKEGFEAILNREFITPETKWAGGLQVGDLKQIRFEHEITGGAPSEEDSTGIAYQRNFQDAWFGRAFLLPWSDNRVNLTVATRLFREEFTERPYVDADSNHFFFNDLLFLNEVVLTKRKYLKSTMIRAFGITEDIPIGYLFKVAGGYEFGEFLDRPYLGFGAAAGGFLDGVGYFSAAAEFGSFFHDQETEEGFIFVEGLYFSPLLKARRNKFRQFVTLSYSSALDPLIVRQFNFTNGIRGITRDAQGDRKFSANFESVLFHPLRLYGFRIASYAFFDFGWIGFEEKLFKSDNFHSSIGLGIRLRNESLLFRTIQLRLAYLTAQSEFDLNFSFSNPTIFNDFRTGKPDIVNF